MIKYFCTEDQNVPLQQNVRPIAAGRTSHYGRTYVPLWQDIRPTVAERNNLPRKKP